MSGVRAALPHLFRRGFRSAKRWLQLFVEHCCCRSSGTKLAWIISMPRLGGLHHRYDLAAGVFSSINSERDSWNSHRREAPPGLVACVQPRFPLSIAVTELPVSGDRHHQDRRRAWKTNLLRAGWSFGDGQVNIDSQVFHRAAWESGRLANYKLRINSILTLRFTIQMGLKSGHCGSRKFLPGHLNGR